MQKKNVILSLIVAIILLVGTMFFLGHETISLPQKNFNLCNQKVFVMGDYPYLGQDNVIHKEKKEMYLINCR